MPRLETPALSHRAARLLRSTALLLLVAGGFASIVASGGGVAPDDDGTLRRTYLGALTITPGSVFLNAGQSATVRIDTNLLPPGDGVTGYAVGSSQTQDTHIEIVTAPCPAGAGGSASCQDWTITPMPGAVPGEHLIDIRSVGARSGDLEGVLKVRVIGAGVNAAAVAVDHGSAEPTPYSMNDGPTLVLLSDGRIAAAGANMSGQVGVGYQPFSLLADSRRYTPRPWFVDEFVIVANGPAFERSVGTTTRGRWLAVAASPRRSFALRNDKTVWTWGNPSGDPIGAGESPFAPRQFTHLPPIKALSAGRDGGGGLALAEDGTVWSLEGLGYLYHLSQLPPKQVTVGVAAPLTDVSAIAGSLDSTALFIRSDGSVWLQYPRQDHAQAVAGLTAPATRIATTRSFHDAGYHLILLADGTLVEGRNVSGGETYRTVSLPGQGFTAISTGAEFAYALRNDGTVWSWRPFQTEPTQVPGLSEIVSLGPDHAIRANCPGATGQVWRIFRGTEAARLRGFSSDIGCSFPAGGSVFDLTLEVNGPGHIEVLPGGTLCRDRCAISIASGAAVRLNAPFANFSTGAGDARCAMGIPRPYTSFSMNENVTCRYTFSREPAAESLPVTIALDGLGRVTSSPPGIDCGSDCTENLTAAYTFLTPVPANGYVFDGFAGAWDCERGVLDKRARESAQGDADRAMRPTSMSPLCTARFVPVAAPPSAKLEVTVNGSGTVASDAAGFSCTTACTAFFPVGTTVVLDPRPSSGHRFAGWSGHADCSDNSVTLSTDRACIATFVELGAPATATLNVEIAGGGFVVISSPAMQCNANCSLPYPIVVPPTPVTLTPQPNQNNAFSAWSGDCSGNTAATVAMNASKTCRASFVPALPSGWNGVGAPLAPALVKGISIAVDLSVPSAPKTYAATTEATAGNRMNLIVRRFDDLSRSWAVMGGGPANADELLSRAIFTPSIAVSAAGIVSIAWAEDENRIRVKQLSADGRSWISLAENLEIDPAARVFGAQIVTAGSHLVVAWIEGSFTSTLSGRMAVKRYVPTAPAGQQWTGGQVRPATETNVLAVRLNTDALGNALLMAVPYSTADPFLLEGPILVLRQAVDGSWNDVCPGASLTTPTGNASTPNVQFGFGIARNTAAGTSGPVAVFNNGAAVFVRACRGAGWVGLDGSAAGEVATAASNGQVFALTLASGEGGGVGLAWSQYAPRSGGGFQYFAEVLVANILGTAVAPVGTTLAFDPNFGVSQNGLSLAFVSDVSPVLGAVLGNAQSAEVEARVFRYTP